MPRPSIETLVTGVLAGDRARLGQAISLVESRAGHHRDEADALLNRLLPFAGRSHRIGISGVPGVGKSTFIEAFGSMLTAAGHRVAVLAVDPTSSRSGGSILGDKTRMAKLASDPSAFIRPSPTAGHLGGVARATRESIIVVEAAGYDIVLVETVGTGQSETMVAEMVDCFVVLMLANAGDELQGIKKGILEHADLIAVNKSDGPDDAVALAACQQYRNALHIVAAASAVWTPQVLPISGLTAWNLDVLWQGIQDHRAALAAAGEGEAKRQRQQVAWMEALVRDRLLQMFEADPAVAARLGDLRRAVAEGQVTAPLAADRLLAVFQASQSVQASQSGQANKSG